jgi:nucleoid-associated protein YgaU
METEHGRKYVLVALLMVAAGYGALQFRRSPSEKIVPLPASAAAASSLPSGVATQVPRSRGRLPVTALADPERAALANARLEKVETKVATADKQPAAQRNLGSREDRESGQRKGNAKSADGKSAADPKKASEPKITADPKKPEDGGKTADVKKAEGKKSTEAKGSKGNGGSAKPPVAGGAALKANTHGESKPSTPPKMPTLAKKEKPSVEQPALNADVDPPPALAERYQPVLSRLDSTHPDDPAPAPPQADSLSDGVHRAIPASRVNDREQERRHRVVDGDTLAQLAQKYLGDERRYLEILCANREVLTDPNLLPIGAELIIPAGDGEPGVSVAQARTKNTTTASAVPVPRESSSAIPTSETPAVTAAHSPPTTSPSRTTPSPAEAAGSATATPRTTSEPPTLIPWDSLPPPPKRG